MEKEMKCDAQKQIKRRNEATEIFVLNSVTKC